MADFGRKIGRMTPNVDAKLINQSLEKSPQNAYY